MDTKHLDAEWKANDLTDAKIRNALLPVFAEASILSLKCEEMADKTDSLFAR